MGSSARAASSAGSICSRVSPTDRPPMPYPSNSRSAIRRARSPCASSRRSRPGRCRTAPGRVGCGRARARSAHAAVRSTASRTTSSALGSGGQTSSTIWMSAPSSCWMATAASGVKRWVEPSYVLWNVTPSSSTFGVEREDLEPTGVGEREAVPAGELGRGHRTGRRCRRRAAASGGTCCRARSGHRLRRSRRR